MSCLDLQVMCLFFSIIRRHTIFDCDWSSDVCSSDLCAGGPATLQRQESLGGSRSDCVFLSRREPPSGSSHDPYCPLDNSPDQLRHYVAVRSSRALEDFKRVVAAVHEVQRGPRAEPLDQWPQQL